MAGRSKRNNMGRIKNNNNSDKSSNKNRPNILVCFLLLVLFLFIYNSKRGTENLRRINSVSSNSNSNSIKNEDFALARKESLGFFDDVSSAHWELLKKKVGDMSPNYNDWALPHKNIETGEERGDRRNKQMGFFYQNHYEPDFVCQHERRIGKLGDGGKWICDPHRIVKQEKCLVYSVGSNNDFSFETFVQKDISTNCEIHTFDFGDYAKGAKEAGGVQYHQVGVGIDNPPRFKSIKTLVKELGHENRIIDVFKIDCEGCEWKTAQHWFDTSVNVTLRQIQVELHGSDIQNTPKFFDLMYEHNYVIFHKEPNIAYPGAIEYAFLKLAPEFSKDIVRAKGAVPGE